MNGFISRFNEYLTQKASFVRKSSEDTELGLIKFIADKIECDPFGNSFFVLDVNDVVAKHRNWSEKLSRVRPFYSVKANNCQMLLVILAQLGVGFDCVTEVYK